MKFGTQHHGISTNLFPSRKLNFISPRHTFPAWGFSGKTFRFCEKISCRSGITYVTSITFTSTSSSRGCEQRSLLWLWNFRLDVAWDAETTRSPARPPPSITEAFVGPPVSNLKCTTAIFSVPKERLGCRRGPPQSTRREAPTRGGFCPVSPRAGQHSGESPAGGVHPWAALLSQCPRGLFASRL